MILRALTPGTGFVRQKASRYDGLVESRRSVDATTASAFEALVSKHNGIFGGCWCMWFHDRSDTGPGAEGNRSAKQQLCSGVRPTTRW